MARDLTLAARLMLDSQRWAAGLSQAGQKTRGFVAGVRREFDHLRGFMRTTTGMLAQVGAGYTVGKAIGDSAKIDQGLTRIKQTAGMTTAQTAKLRAELHGMAGSTGNSFDSLQEGFGQLVAGGLSFESSLPTIDAINTAMRVTGSEATTLATALQSAQEHFGFDLAKSGQALELLDKMTVAGRAGVIEIEDLSNVFATAAVNAKAAGLDFNQTLALVEGLGTATTKDRVGTLVDSTLRVFTNANYMKEAQKATGIKFFDKKGERRNALDVIADIKGAYDKLKTDEQRFKFISKAFGKADLDTVKGIQAAMRDGKLEKILQIAKESRAAAGTLHGDMAEAMDNTIAQAGKLKERLAEAADRFAQPINAVLTRGIKKLTGKKEDGGLDLSGGQLLGGGAAALAGTYVLGKVLKGALGRLFGGTASLGTGVAMGSALEKAGAATPVFVVGAAPGLFAAGGGGAAGLAADAAATATAAAVGRKIGTQAILMAAARTLPVSAMATMGMAGAATVGAGVVAAAAGGVAIGTAIRELALTTEKGRSMDDSLGRGISQMLAFFGNKNAQEALDNEKSYQRMLLSDGIDASFKTLAGPDAGQKAKPTPAPAAAPKALPKTSLAGTPVKAPAVAAKAAAKPQLAAVPKGLPKTSPAGTPAKAPAVAAKAAAKPQLAAVPNAPPKASTQSAQRVASGKITSTDAPAIAAAIAQKLTARPLRGQLEVRITDTRVTVTPRPGGDFTSVRSSNTRAPLNTGRAMGGGG